MSESAANENGSSSQLQLLIPVVLGTLRRHALLATVVIAAGACFGLFNGLVAPNQYQSVGKLFVRPGVRESFAPDTLIAGGAGAPRVSGMREAVGTAMQVLAAPEFFVKIASRTGANTVLAPYDPAASNTDGAPWHVALFHAFQSWWFTSESAFGAESAGDPQQIASLLLQRTLSILPEAGANVIRVSYVSNSPDRARAVVNAALDAAREWHREVFERMWSLTALENEAATADTAAQEAESRLRDFRTQHGIDDYETQRESLLRYITDLDQQIDRLDIDMKGREAEQAELSTQFTAIPTRRVLAGSTTPVVNPTHTYLANILGQLWSAIYELERAEGTTDSKRPRQELLEKQIRDVKARLEQEPMQIQLQGSEIDNPDYQRIALRLADLIVEQKRLASQRAQLLVARNASRGRLTSIENHAPRLRIIEEDAKQKRAFADGLASSISSQKTLQRLEQMKLSELSVMHYGTLEPEKIAPKRSRMVVLGFLGGAALAAGLVVALALLDRRVRVRTDLIRLGLPEEGVLVASVNPSPEDPNWPLPASLADAREDIARFWAMLPYERRSQSCLRLGFVPCGENAAADRAAASFAIGIAAHGGERVVYVSCREGPTWLTQRLAPAKRRGWHEVLRGQASLDDAVTPTAIAGLDYLSAGPITGVVPHPMAGAAFTDLLDSLSGRYRFILLELPDLEDVPEGQSTLGIADAAMLVACRDHGDKEAVRRAIAAVKTSGSRLLGGVLQAPRTPPPSS